jgi:hypothetical protein
MADGEDIQPLVCDNGTGMVKVSPPSPLTPNLLCTTLFPSMPLIMCTFYSSRLVLLATMHQGLFSLVLLAVLATLVLW